MKNSVFGVMLVSGMLLLASGCAPDTTPPPPEAEDTPPVSDTQDTEQPTPAQAGDIGNLTDDLWVEMAAQELYHSIADPEEWREEGGRDRMFGRYGVTEAQLEAYGAMLNENPDRAMVVINKMSARVKELELEFGKPEAIAE